MMDFKEELKKVPEKPGVYLMHSADGKVIYVGKAVILRRRLSSYFNSSPHTERITCMIRKIDYFEFIVTDSEYEALLLECNLIKKYRPKYNVLLKDDRNYPYIKVTLNEDFPRVTEVHKPVKDGAKYFGPYYSVYSMKSTLETFSKIFPTRNCSVKINPEKPQRVCLNYHIGLCPGPCAGYVTPKEYRKNVDAICDFLSGRSNQVIGTLRAEMLAASEETDFERAAELRDRIRALEVMSEKQKIMLGNGECSDALAVAVNETDAVLQVFHIVGGKISGRDYFVFEGAGAAEKSEIVLSFIPQFYENSVLPPKKILCENRLPEEETSLLEEMLSENFGHRVSITVPVRGEKRRLMEMTLKNAEIALENYELAKRAEDGGALSVLQKMKDLAGLEGMPLRIEAFDISNLGDSEIDGSMVVFANGKPAKSDYRHFKIKSLEQRSDVGSMREMLTRRYTRLKNGDRGFEKRPDLILMDGGITQIHEAQAVLRELNLEDVRVLGMVKDNRHRSRGLMNGEGEEFPLENDAEIWRFITDVQNEAHRFAIEYNRKLTEKRYKKSPLDDIPGVGDKRKLALLRKFGSVKGIREASAEEIAGVDRIGEKLAEQIKKSLEEGKK